jgi:hypothetical protein
MGDPYRLKSPITENGRAERPVVLHEVAISDPS